MEAVPRRRVRTITEARELVAAWRASGLNKESWCRSQGILRSALLSCLSRVEALDGPGVVPGFIEVRPGSRAVPPPGSLIVELGSGMRLVGLDAAGAVALIRSLRQEGG